MTDSNRDSPVQALLLDIEGTTTPLAFVTQTLFPYARRRFRDFLEHHLSSEEVSAELARLREENTEDRRRGLKPPLIEEGPPQARLDSLAAYVHWLMDQDRKSTPLKLLQGKIWEGGYQTGELRGEMFDDVLPALERWHRQNKAICIFSSGSVLAQQLLFKNTTSGDLTKFIARYFDTTSGAKTDRESYRRIAASLHLLPSQVVFISDVMAELDAAQSAGMQTVLCIRPGNRPQPGPSTHPVIRSFAEMFP